MKPIFINTIVDSIERILYDDALYQKILKATKIANSASYYKKNNSRYHIKYFKQALKRLEKRKLIKFKDRITYFEVWKV